MPRPECPRSRATIPLEPVRDRIQGVDLAPLQVTDCCELNTK